MKIVRIKKIKYTFLSSLLFITPIFTFLMMKWNNIDLYSPVPDDKKIIPLPEISLIDNDKFWVTVTIISFIIWLILNFKIIDNNEDN